MPFKNVNLILILLMSFFTVSITASAQDNEDLSPEVKAVIVKLKQRCSQPGANCNTMDAARELVGGYTRLKTTNDDAWRLLSLGEQLIRRDIVLALKNDNKDAKTTIALSEYITGMGSEAMALMNELSNKLHDEQGYKDERAWLVKLISTVTINELEREIVSHEHPKEVEKILTRYVNIFDAMAASYLQRGQFYYYNRDDVKSKADLTQALKLQNLNNREKVWVNYMMTILSDPTKTKQNRDYLADSKEIKKIQKSAQN